MSEHYGAINYDLMTRTRYTLDDVGGVLSWDSLHSFITHLRSDSALARELGKATGWEDTIKTNALLADLYDLLQAVNANLQSIATHGKKKQKIRPYPRPGKDDNNTRKIGKKALPYNSLREWIKERQHG